MEKYMIFTLPKRANELEADIAGQKVFYRPLDAVWRAFCACHGLRFDGDILSFCRFCEEESQGMQFPVSPHTLPKIGVVMSPATSPERGAVARRLQESLGSRPNWPPPPMSLAVAPPAKAAMVAQSKRPPPWYVAFTNQFRDQLAGLDRKLLGRVLEKIAELTVNPMQILGDTIKPLDGDFKGLWRIRFGDYRMIYFPDKEHGNISIYSLAPRGSAYD